MTDLPVWLNGKEAAEYVGVSWPTFRRFVLDHDIPRLEMGPRTWRFNTRVLQDHLDRLADMQAAS